MNETDYLRQQLATERTHLREILVALNAATATVRHPRPIEVYIDWAGRRLAAATRAQLAQVATAAEQAGAAKSAPHLHPAALLALLEAWNDGLDALAGTQLRIAHWRQAAHLSADTILEERQLYGAARSAVGLS
jgi:hypothetical protein